MKKLAVLLLAACVALGGAGCKNSVSDTVSGLVEDAVQPFRPTAASMGRPTPLNRENWWKRRFLISR